MSIEGLSRKRSGSIVSKHFESRCFIKIATVRNWAIEVVNLSHAPVQDLESEKAWPTFGKGQTEAAQHSPSQRLFLPGWLLPSQPQLPPLKPQSCDSSDDQKAKAAPKIGSRRNWKASAKVTPKLSPTFKWSPSHRSSASTAAAAADLDPLPQPQQPAQEEKEDKHEKEDKQDWVQPSGEPGCRQQWVCIRISGSGADSTPGIKLRA